MADKKSFIAYNDWRGSFDKLPDEIAGRLIKALFAHADGDEINDSDYAIVAIMEQFKSTMKRDAEKWANQVEQRSLAGKASAEQRALTKSNERSTTVNEIERKPTDTENVSVSVNVSESNSEKQLPTLDDFIAYAKTIATENKKDEAFCISQVKLAHAAYTENKWRDAKDNPVKNWRAKLLNGYLKLEKLPPVKKQGYMDMRNF